MDLLFFSTLYALGISENDIVTKETPLIGCCMNSQAACYVSRFYSDDLLCDSERIHALESNFGRTIDTQNESLSYIIKSLITPLRKGL